MAEVKVTGEDAKRIVAIMDFDTNLINEDLTNIELNLINPKLTEANKKCNLPKTMNYNFKLSKSERVKVFKKAGYAKEGVSLFAYVKNLCDNEKFSFEVEYNPDGSLNTYTSCIDNPHNKDKYDTNYPLRIIQTETDVKVHYRKGSETKIFVERPYDAILSENKKELYYFQNNIIYKVVSENDNINFELQDCEIPTQRNLDIEKCLKDFIQQHEIRINEKNTKSPHIIPPKVVQPATIIAATLATRFTPLLPKGQEKTIGH